MLFALMYSSQISAQAFQFDWGALGWVDGCVVVGTACQQSFTNVNGSGVDVTVDYPRAGRTNANNPESPNVDGFDHVAHYTGDPNVLRFWKPFGEQISDLFVITFSQPVTLNEIGFGGARPNSNNPTSWSHPELTLWSGPNGTGAKITAPSSAVGLVDVANPDPLLPGQISILDGTNTTWSSVGVNNVMGDATAALVNGTYYYAGLETPTPRAWVYIDFTGALLATQIQSITWDAFARDTDQAGQGNIVDFDFSSSHYITGFGFDVEALPVELEGFNIEKGENGSAILKWSTLSEDNNSGFFIEHAESGKEFEVSGFVAGAGNSEVELDYVFTKSDLLPGIHYFRLRQMDFDGQVEFSKVLEHTVAMPEQIYLSDAYPNPFNPETRISFILAERGYLSVELYNINGRLVQTLHAGITEANSKTDIKIDGADLESGTYFVHAEGIDFEQTRVITLLK